MIELTDRTSSVMQVTEGEEFYSAHDPVVNAFRTFAQLNDLAVSGRVAVVPSTSYAETLTAHASDVASDFSLIPWSENGGVTEDSSVPYSVSASDRFKSAAYLDFVCNTLKKASRTSNTGIFINNGFGGIIKPVDRPRMHRSKSSISIRSQRDMASLPVADRSHHVFFPFFGGPDDHVALRFVLQLAKNHSVSTTIAHINLLAQDAEGSVSHVRPQESTSAAGSKAAAVQETTRIVEQASAADVSLLHTLQSSLPRELIGRVVFREINVTSTTALKDTVSTAQEVVGQSPKNAGDIVVVGRTHLHLGDSPLESGSLGSKGNRRCGCRAVRDAGHQSERTNLASRRTGSGTLTVQLVMLLALSQNLS